MKDESLIHHVRRGRNKNINNCLNLLSSNFGSVVCFLWKLCGSGTGTFGSPIVL